MMAMGVNLYKTNRLHMILASCFMLLFSLGKYFHPEALQFPYEFEIVLLLWLVVTLIYLTRRVGVDQRGVFVACYAFGKVLWEVKRFPFDEVAMGMYKDKKTVVLLTTTGKISGRFRGQGRLDLGADVQNRRALLETLVERIPDDNITPNVFQLIENLKT